MAALGYFALNSVAPFSLILCSECSKLFGKDGLPSSSVITGARIYCPTIVMALLANLLAKRSSATLEPSYVLRALGLSDELAHSSIRFSFGKYTTEEDIDHVLEVTKTAVQKLRDLSPLWDMFKEGIDLSKVEWTEH